MDRKEALEILKTHNEKCSGCDKLCDDLCKPAVKLAITALEKQIPIEHHHTKIATLQDGARLSVCPKCLGVICTGTDEYPRFCTWCGQAIDWGKE